jgi:hypothetical protein
MKNVKYTTRVGNKTFTVNDIFRKCNEIAIASVVIKDKWPGMLRSALATHQATTSIHDRYQLHLHVRIYFCVRRRHVAH